MPRGADTEHEQNRRHDIDTEQVHGGKGFAKRLAILHVGFGSRQQFVLPRVEDGAFAATYCASCLTATAKDNLTDEWKAFIRLMRPLVRRRQDVIANRADIVAAIADNLYPGSNANVNILRLCPPFVKDVGAAIVDVLPELIQCTLGCMFTSKGAVCAHFPTTRNVFVTHAVMLRDIFDHIVDNAEATERLFESYLPYLAHHRGDIARLTAESVAVLLRRCNKEQAHTLLPVVFSLFKKPEVNLELLSNGVAHLLAGMLSGAHRTLHLRTAEFLPIIWDHFKAVPHFIREKYVMPLMRRMWKLLIKATSSQAFAIVWEFLQGEVKTATAAWKSSPEGEEKQRLNIYVGHMFTLVKDLMKDSGKAIPDGFMQAVVPCVYDCIKDLNQCENLTKWSCLNLLLGMPTAVLTPAETLRLVNAVTQVSDVYTAAKFWKSVIAVTRSKQDTLALLLPVLCTWLESEFSATTETSPAQPPITERLLPFLVDILPQITDAVEGYPLHLFPNIVVAHAQRLRLGPEQNAQPSATETRLVALLEQTVDLFSTAATAFAKNEVTEPINASTFWGLLTALAGIDLVDRSKVAAQLKRLRVQFQDLRAQHPRDKVVTVLFATVIGCEASLFADYDSHEKVKELHTEILPMLQQPLPQPVEILAAVEHTVQLAKKSLGTLQADSLADFLSCLHPYLRDPSTVTRQLALNIATCFEGMALFTNVCEAEALSMQDIEDLRGKQLALENFEMVTRTEQLPTALFPTAVEYLLGALYIKYIRVWPLAKKGLLAVAERDFETFWKHFSPMLIERTEDVRAKLHELSPATASAFPFLLVPGGVSPDENLRVLIQDDEGSDSGSSTDDEEEEDEEDEIMEPKEARKRKRDDLRDEGADHQEDEDEEAETDDDADEGVPDAKAARREGSEAPSDGTEGTTATRMSAKQRARNRGRAHQLKMKAALRERFPNRKREAQKVRLESIRPKTVTVTGLGAAFLRRLGKYENLHVSTLRTDDNSYLRNLWEVATTLSQKVSQYSSLLYDLFVEFARANELGASLDFVPSNDESAKAIKEHRRVSEIKLLMFLECFGSMPAPNNLPIAERLQHIYITFLQSSSRQVQQAAFNGLNQFGLPAVTKYTEELEKFMSPKELNTCFLHFPIGQSAPIDVPLREDVIRMVVHMLRPHVMRIYRDPDLHKRALDDRPANVRNKKRKQKGKGKVRQADFSLRRFWQYFLEITDNELQLVFDHMVKPSLPNLAPRSTQSSGVVDIFIGRTAKRLREAEDSPVNQYSLDMTQQSPFKAVSDMRRGRIFLDLFGDLLQFLRHRCGPFLPELTAGLCQYALLAMNFAEVYGTRLEKQVSLTASFLEKIWDRLIQLFDIFCDYEFPPEFLRFIGELVDRTTSRSRSIHAIWPSVRLLHAFSQNTTLRQLFALFPEWFPRLIRVLHLPDITPPQVKLVLETVRAIVEEGSTEWATPILKYLEFRETHPDSGIVSLPETSNQAKRRRRAGNLTGTGDHSALTVTTLLKSSLRDAVVGSHVDLLFELLFETIQKVRLRSVVHPCFLIVKACTDYVKASNNPTVINNYVETQLRFVISELTGKQPGVLGEKRKNIKRKKQPTEDEEDFSFVNDVLETLRSFVAHCTVDIFEPVSRLFSVVPRFFQRQALADILKQLLENDARVSGDLGIADRISTLVKSMNTTTADGERLDIQQALNALHELPEFLLNFVTDLTSLWRTGPQRGVNNLKRQAEEKRRVLQQYNVPEDKVNSGRVRFVAKEGPLPTARQLLPLVHTLSFHIENGVQSLYMLAGAALSALVDITPALSASPPQFAVLYDLLYQILCKGMRNEDVGRRKAYLQIARSFSSSAGDTYPGLRRLFNADINQDFYYNLVSPHVHRRFIAFVKFTETFQSTPVAPEKLVFEFFSPLFLSLLRDASTGKLRYDTDDNIESKDVAVLLFRVGQCLGTLAHHLGWNSYHTFLGNLLRQTRFSAEENPRYAAGLAHAVSSVLDAFHFSISSASPAEREIVEVKFGKKAALAKAPDTIPEKNLMKIITSIRKLLKAIDNPRDRAKPQLEFALFKLIMQLSEQRKQTEIISELHDLTSSISTKIDAVREKRRALLMQVAQFLGPKYLFEICDQLNTKLLSGYQLHLHGHVAFDLLRANRKQLLAEHAANTARAEGTSSLDRCFPLLLDIFLDDWMGAVAEIKANAVNRMAMREAVETSGLHGIQFLARYCTFDLAGPQLIDRCKVLLSPVTTNATAAARKIVEKVRDVMKQVARGFSRNPSASAKAVLVYIFKTLEENCKMRDERIKAIEDELGLKMKIDAANSKPEILTRQQQLERAFLTFAAPVRSGELYSHSTAVLSSTHRRIVGHSVIGKDNKLQEAFQKRKQKLRTDEGAQAVLDTIDEFCLLMLGHVLRAAPTTLEYNQMLDPYVGLLVKVVRGEGSDAVITLALKSLASLVGRNLPSAREHVLSIFDTALDILERGSNIRALAYGVIQAIFRLPSSATQYVDANQQTVVLSLIANDIDSNLNLHAAITLLGELIKRKVQHYQIYDVMSMLSELLVRADKTGTSRVCSSVLIDFLSLYPMTEPKMHTHLEWILQNLKYPHEPGRRALLNLLQTVVQRFPQRFVTEKFEMLLLPLVVVLSTDTSSECRRLAADAIIAIVRLVPDDVVVKLLVLWAPNEKLRATTMQVATLLVRARKKACAALLPAFLPLVLDNLTSLARYELTEDGLTVQKTKRALTRQRDSWEVVYHSMACVDKLLAFRPSLAQSPELGQLWPLIAGGLLHVHVWVRTVAARIVSVLLRNVTGALFGGKQRAKLLDEEADPQAEDATEDYTAAPATAATLASESTAVQVDWDRSPLQPTQLYGLGRVFLQQLADIDRLQAKLDDHRDLELSWVNRQIVAQGALVQLAVKNTFIIFRILRTVTTDGSTDYFSILLEQLVAATQAVQSAQISKESGDYVAVLRYHAVQMISTVRILGAVVHTCGRDHPAIANAVSKLHPVAQAVRSNHFPPKYRTEAREVLELLSGGILQPTPEPSAPQLKGHRRQKKKAHTTRKARKAARKMPSKTFRALLSIQK
eukprot:TRINITY_DN649_c0_g1_i1.p1 TRINITY_DN649_c0_g1~~TRINITY_DN649_c0_g1_i1.p1  ORF type:complete len:3070 (+),score=524.98 TRINITY_DN649_c0_g1_i1:22-9210(+)